jgi:hypothetical protein
MIQIEWTFHFRSRERRSGQTERYGQSLQYLNLRLFGPNIPYQRAHSPTGKTRGPLGAAIDRELYVREETEPSVRETEGERRSAYGAARISPFYRTKHASNWHPLTWLSHMLDMNLYGLNPGGHHLTNLFFHLANTLLLFWVLKWMTGALWRSGFVALLFALHPLHVESVAWVAERKDVLSTFFWMLTMGAYVHYVHQRSLKRYLLVFFFFTLGLMSKPMLVTLPFVLLLLDYWPLGRLQIGSKVIRVRRNKSCSNSANGGPGLVGFVWEKVPLFVLVIIWCIVTLWAQRGAVASLEAIPIGIRLANALISYVSYIGKMIWPARLAVLYPYPERFPLWQVAGAGLFLLRGSGFSPRGIQGFITRQPRFGRSSIPTKGSELNNEEKEKNF